MPKRGHATATYYTSVTLTHASKWSRLDSVWTARGGRGLARGEAGGVGGRVAYRQMLIEALRLDAGEPLAAIEPPLDILPHLRGAVRRTSHQAYRLELLAAALTDAASRTWSVVPPPTATSAVAQHASLRRQLRILAVMCTCFEPFQEWWRIVHDSRAERLITSRSEAGGAARTARLRQQLLGENYARVRKQDATLRAFTRRTRLRAALALWRVEARELSRLAFARRVLMAEWMWRWRTSASFFDRHGPPRGMRLRRRLMAVGLHAFGAERRVARWLASVTRRLELTQSLRHWRRRRRTQLTRLAAAAFGARSGVRNQKLRAVRAWYRVWLRATKHALQELQDGSLRSLLRLWSSSAKSVVSVLSAWPAESEAETSRVLCLLGGTWTGGVAALDVGVRETATFKTRLVQERQATISAGLRSDGSAVRVDELFSMLAQQRANVGALASVIRRTETDLLCLQKSLALADAHAAVLAERPHVRVAGASATRDPRATTSAAIATGDDGGPPAELPPLPLLRPGTPPTPADERAKLGLPSKPPLPPRAEVAGLVAASETMIRTRMSTAEARCCHLEGRLASLERKLQRAVEKVTQRRQAYAEAEAEALFSPAPRSSPPPTQGTAPTEASTGRASPVSASPAVDAPVPSPTGTFSALAREAEAAAAASMQRLAMFDAATAR